MDWNAASPSRPSLTSRIMPWDTIRGAVWTQAPGTGKNPVDSAPWFGKT
jgi:hypothetical protein